MPRKKKVTVTRVQVYKRDGQWRFRAKGGNGEVIAWGESYKNQDDCLAAAEAIAPGIEPEVTP
jgi:uncharacterized protein YegP (UPF0339 family)